MFFKSPQGCNFGASYYVKPFMSRKSGVLVFFMILLKNLYLLLNGREKFCNLGLFRAPDMQLLDGLFIYHFSISSRCTDVMLIGEKSLRFIKYLKVKKTIIYTSSHSLQARKMTNSHNP